MKKLFTLLLLAFSLSMQSQTAAALNFDGTNDYVNIGTVIPVNSSYTKEAWIYANANGSNNIISSGSSPFWLSGTHLSAYTNNNGSVILQDAAVFPLNQWVHVAVTYNAANSALRLYKSGVLVASGITSGSYPADVIAIGQYGPSQNNFFQGSIDEVRIWSRALCQAEIQNNMSAELTLPQTGLLAYYKFNQGVAAANNSAVTTLTDASGNTSTGTLYNFALTGSSSNWVSPGGVTTGSVAPTFTAPAIIAAILSQTSTCAGTNGALTVTTNVAASSYSWMPSGGTASVATGLAAGVYTCVINSFCGASVAVTATIAPPTSLTASITVTNPHCQGGFGSATVSVLGGSGSYNYAWSNSGAGNSIAFAYAGNYSVTVTDANCSVSGTAAATVVDPPAIYYTYSNMGIPCHGGTGSASVSATGGSGTFNYLWSNGSTSQMISGQLPGTYSVTISDTYSCTQSTSFTFVDPSVLTSSTSITQPLCIGGTGIATITASGGTTPYNYSITALSYNPVINNLSAGVYTVTTKDANDCTVTNTITIVAPPALTLTATAGTPTVCAGNSTTLTANGTGGTSPFTYTWTSGPNTATYAVSPSVNTTYTVNATDANGCSASKLVSVTTAQTPTLTVSNGSICTGQTFTFSPSGAATYTYSSGSNTVNPSATTSYTLLGTSANGCVSGSVAVTVSVNTTPTITVNSATICSGSSVAIVPAGAASYSITGNTFAVAPSVNTSYTVTGASAAGCVSGIAVSTVSVNATPAITANSGSICSGNSFTITPSGNTGGTYTITGGTYIVSPLITTTYNVAGTATNGCTSSNAVVTVSVNANPVITANNSTICAGASAVITPSGAANYTISGGTFTVSPITSTTYSLSGSSANGCASSGAIITVSVNANPTITVNSLTICSGNSAVITPSGALTYSISGGTFTVSPLINTSYTVSGTNANGCISSSVAATISVNATPTLVANVSVDATQTLSAGNSGTVCSGQSVTLSASGATTYSWSNPSSTGAIVVITPMQTTTYSVTGITGNCSALATVTVVIDLCTGIKENAAGIVAAVYPNPTNGQLVVETEVHAMVTVVNVTGQEVLKQSTTGAKTEISLAAFTPGIYFVKIRSGNSQKVVKVVKN